MNESSKKFLTNSEKSKIVTEIVNQLEGCEEFIISVAFITFGGVICIIESLRKLKLKNIKGKILTGSYLNFTEPKALKKLLEFSNVEVKMLESENFHAKGFFFLKKNHWQAILGSTNLTQSALTVNSEWNILFKAKFDEPIIQQIFNEFDRLFNKAVQVSKIMDNYEQKYNSIKNSFTFENFAKTQKIVPNFIQEQALSNLRRLRENGKDKALIISATGTGKTFLSAFDVLAFKPRRCLFVVHRTNIAVKAKNTYSKIIKGRNIGLLIGGNKSSADYLFATIQTLKNQQVLHSFQPNNFDYIIIDEVHHAEAESYKKVLSYFRPKFLLGMTATPERTDDADIFKLFDYNIAYEIRLHQALEQDLLCPFHYFAIEDFYVESEKILAKNFTKLTSQSRVNHIVEKMNFYGFSGQSRAALMFVSSVDEAVELSKKLNQKGMKAQALTSQDPEYIRETAIRDLEQHRLEILITVDIFNEGVDIPCVNQVILLRPTQSAIVYVQQLGRGLRKFQDKRFVVVLDFIANYENNFLVPVALSQDNSYDKDELKKFVVSPNNHISGKSTITFTDIAAELIYRNIQKTNFSQLKNIKKDYKQLKKELGRVPRLVDFQRYNFISPEIILSTKNTYYDVLKTLKEEVSELNIRQYNILCFISKELTPAKRLYEILILEKLLLCSSVEKNSLENELKTKIIDFDWASFENALEHLALQIFTVNAGRQNYEPLISFNYEEVKLLISFEIRASAFLLAQIQDLLEYNKLIYMSKYKRNKYQGLSLYSKYSKKDIAHLLNQDYTNGGVNLAGYRVFDNKALLFMTFDESKKFTKYDNKFISSKEFTFYSKERKTLKDPIEKALVDNKYIIYVFARIDKVSSYFYLGTVAKCIYARELETPKKLVEYTFELNQNLPDDIWKYFKVVYKSKN